MTRNQVFKFEQLLGIIVIGDLTIILLCQWHLLLYVRVHLAVAISLITSGSNALE